LHSVASSTTAERIPAAESTDIIDYGNAGAKQAAEKNRFFDTNRAATVRAAGNAEGVRLWDEGVHPEEIARKAFFQQKLDYIHANPVRAGYVDAPCEWRYSSAGFQYRAASSVVCITPLDW